MLPSADSYEDLNRRFAWNVPARYNIGVDVCDRHAAARPDAPALIFEDEDGRVATWSFAHLKAQSDRFANALAAHGVVPGDRVAVLLQQSREAAVAHIGAYKAGMIAVPLFVLFGEDALEYRLGDCAAACIVTDPGQLPKILAIRARLPGLRAIFVVGGRGRDGTIDFDAALERASDNFRPVDTEADDVTTWGATLNDAQVAAVAELLNDVGVGALMLRQTVDDPLLG